MIAGIGADLIEVERIGFKMGKETGFRELVFSKNEIDYCESKANPFEHYAARFAAKEAFFKALGTGWIEGAAFNEIEVKNDEKGKPELYFLGETQKTIADFGIHRIFVSLSHLNSIATAIVIIEK